MPKTPRCKPRFLSPGLVAVGFLLVAAGAWSSPVSYHINAELNSSGDLLGTATVIIRNESSEPLSVVELRPNETRITRVECLAESVRAAVALDNGVLVVEPAIAPGDSLILELGFAGRGRQAGPLVVFRGWYPEVGPGRSADFSVKLTVPGELVVAATGGRVNQQEELAWMRWPPEFRKLTQPNRKVLEFTATSVPEFVWAAGADLVLLDADSSLEVLARYQDRFAWLDAPQVAREVIDYYSGWYGPSPSGESQISNCQLPIGNRKSVNGHVTVVDAYRCLGSDESYPGLALATSRPVTLTRVFEQALARQLACQWFRGPDARVTDGLAEFSAMRFLESAYGPGNMLALPFDFFALRGASAEYVNRLLVYLAETNHLLGPEAPENPLLRQAYDARTGLFFAGLARSIGPDSFDLALRRFLSTERTEADFADMFGQPARAWFERPGPWDNAVRSVRRSKIGTDVRLSQRGHVAPVEVKVDYATGMSERLVWNPARGPTLSLDGPVRCVTVDPDQEFVETDRWNNSWPRRVEAKPVFSLPSFEAYQCFYGPYAWYDNYHGVQMGAWVQGREFIIGGPLRGRHMWMLSETYSTRLDDWHTSASYQTPVSPVSDRLRFSLLLDYSLLAAGVRVNFVQELGNAFGLPNGVIDVGYRFYDLYDTKFRDTFAWDVSRIADLRLRLEHAAGNRVVRSKHALVVSRGMSELGGNYRFWKATFEENLRVDFGARTSITVRGFAGYINGEIPNQEQFYLSGGLYTNQDEPVSWGLEGMSSGQEHWHYDADVNCRGFSGTWRHGRFGYGANVFLYPVRQVALFFDAGNVSDSPRVARTWEPKLDAGVRLRLGPMYADFPFWRYSQEAGHEFAFRWMLGLKLSGLLGG